MSNVLKHLQTHLYDMSILNFTLKRLHPPHPIYVFENSRLNDSKLLINRIK